MVCRATCPPGLLGFRKPLRLTASFCKLQGEGILSSNPKAARGSTHPFQICDCVATPHHVMMPRPIRSNGSTGVRSPALHPCPRVPYHIMQILILGRGYNLWGFLRSQLEKRIYAPWSMYCRRLNPGGMASTSGWVGLNLINQARQKEVQRPFASRFSFSPGCPFGGRCCSGRVARFPRGHNRV